MLLGAIGKSWFLTMRSREARHCVIALDEKKKIDGKTANE